MDRLTYEVLGVCGILTLILIILLVYNKRRKHRTDGIYTVKQKTGNKNWLAGIYNFYRTMPFLKKTFVKVKSRIEIIYPADVTSVNKKTSETLLMITGVGIFGITASLLLARSDVFFFMVGVATTYIVIGSMVNSSFKKMDKLILKQFAEFLSTMRHYYNDCHIVETALALSLDECPYEIGLHMQKIYDIIISPDTKYETEQYVGREPNKFVLLFLSICVSTKEYGDKTLENGSSLFITNLDYLTEEVNNENLAKRINDDEFMGLTTWAIVPIFALKPMQWWAESNMPEVSQYYKGIYGVVSLIISFLLCIVVHSLITSLRDGEQELDKDNDIWATVANSTTVSPWLNRMIFRKYAKYEKYDEQLKGMGNRTGPKAFLLKRIVYAVSTCIVTIVILFGAGLSQKWQYVNNWASAFDESIAPSDEYRAQMELVAFDYAAKVKGQIVNEEDLTEDIINNTEIKNATYANEIAVAVNSRMVRYQNTYFKWFYLLIALGLSWVAYMAPVLLLKFKKTLISTRQEEEIIQFQSIMLILMNMNGTTQEVILEWMERFSYCFKESIANCRVNLNYGMKKALLNMKFNSSYKPFMDFIDNLISIDKVGVEKAFGEIRISREHYKKTREEDRKENIRKKSGKAKLIVFVPLFLSMAFYLMVPMIIYAISMLSVFNTTI